MALMEVLMIKAFVSMCGKILVFWTLKIFFMKFSIQKLAFFDRKSNSKVDHYWAIRPRENLKSTNYCQGSVVVSLHHIKSADSKTLRLKDIH